MLESRVARVVAVVVLLGALFSLTVWYGSLSPDPTVGAYPGTEELAGDYDRYLGERVAIGGRIVGTEPVVIVAEYGVDSELRLRVVGLDDSVRPVKGDQLRVFGTVEPGRTVRALNAFTVPAWGIRYMLSVSFLAGLWMLGRIIRYWRVDWGSLALSRRERPLDGIGGVRSRVRRLDDDA
jgi:hypothetical protein